MPAHKLTICHPCTLDRPEFPVNIILHHVLSAKHENNTANHWFCTPTTLQQPEISNVICAFVTTKVQQTVNITWIIRDSALLSTTGGKYKGRWLIRSQTVISQPNHDMMPVQSMSLNITTKNAMWQVYIYLHKEYHCILQRQSSTSNLKLCGHDHEASWQFDQKCTK